MKVPIMCIVALCFALIFTGCKEELVSKKAAARERVDQKVDEMGKAAGIVSFMKRKNPNWVVIDVQPTASEYAYIVTIEKFDPSGGKSLGTGRLDIYYDEDGWSGWRTGRFFQKKE